MGEAQDDVVDRMLHVHFANVVRLNVRYNGRQRFEVEGADAAVELLRQHDCNSTDQ